MLRKLTWLDVSDNRISHIAANYLPRFIITLNLSDNLFTEVPVNMLEHLHQLRSLFMRNNLIKSLTNIEQHPNVMLLERFDVSYNAIEEFPTEMFNRNSTIKIIIMEKNLLRRLPANGFRNLSTSRIALAHNRLTHIESDAFGGLEDSLEHLDLEHNMLKEIPKAVMPLRHLNHLYLPSNRISVVDELPKSIKALSLAANNLTIIPVNALKMCHNLMYLNMGYNKIIELPENVFAEWGNKLETVFLRNNKITSLNYGSLNGLDSIKELSLSFNDIHYLHPMAFENISKTLNIFEMSFGLYRDDFPTEQFKFLTELMWLSLDNNNLKKITDESLITLSELVHINLSFNRITMFPPAIFIAEIHKKLKEIDLSYNLLTRIYTNTFDSLLNLRTVRLSSNRIQLLDTHAYHNLPELTYVDLTHNLLRNISENVFTFLPQLMQLDLMHNHLEHLTFKIFKHASNESQPLHLNISHNRLTMLDGEINSFLYIRSIDATANYLNDSQSFRNLGYSLKELILRKNSFTTLNNHAFNELYNLDWLDVSFNNLSVLRRRCFQGLANLQKLELNNNHINQLQTDQFADLRNLRVLNLAHNRIRSLPREIFVHTRIEYLDLSNNQLTLWPANSLSDIGFTLRNVRMAANEIEYLEPNMFINTQYVYTLDLSKNKLVVIPDNTFSYLSNLTNLDLSNNPLVTANLEQIFHHTPMLRVLNLRAMGLYHMPSMTVTHHLTELDVSINNLQETSSLNRLKYLRVLKMAQNKVSNISALADRLPSTLRSLDLSRNPIKRVLLSDFVRLRLLEELYMRGCMVRNAMAFAQLINLKILHLDAQPLYGDIVANMHGLQELRIEVHGEVLDGTILAKLRNHTKINSIEITGRHLTSITANAFVGLAHSYDLKLKIHGTQIVDFPPKIFYALRSIPHLSIDLSNNNVANLAPDSFYPNASSWDAVGTRSIIGGLDIYGNPLQCECGLVWLGHWLRRWLREVCHVHSLTDEEYRDMLEVSSHFVWEMKFVFNFFFSFFRFFFPHLQRARRNTCIEPQTGKVIPFLEIFPEDLLCHASALSSSAVNKCLFMPIFVRIFLFLTFIMKFDYSIFM